MTFFLAGTRVVHMGSLTLLVGLFTFLLVVARPAFRRAADQGGEAAGAFEQGVIRLARGTLVVAVVSALGWLGVQAVLVSGQPLPDALAPRLLGRVLTQTEFGRVWQLRLGLLVLLGALVAWHDRTSSPRGRLALEWAGVLLGSGSFAALTWAGHAAATEGAARLPHLAADVAHLLATGAWLGGLLPLAFLLRTARRVHTPAWEAAAREATRRFSGVGLMSVGSLLLTGGVSAWVLVGSVAGLVGTPYGQLLLLKLAGVGLVIGVAAHNRLRLLPGLLRTEPPDAEAAGAERLRRLERNVWIELGVGAGILGIVGILGIIPPAAHAQPTWPFPFRLTWAAPGQLLAIDAYPTTYRRPAVPYQAASIANGLHLYQTHCVLCHGATGSGDGPAGQALRPPPADLTARHTGDHTAGDLFWWLSHGIRGSAMPGFQDQLSETDRWDIINFLRALSAAEQARSLGPVVEPTPWLIAPDFTFDRGGGGVETLKEQRGQAMVHLVLFTLPDSQPRLDRLETAWPALTQAGARVLTVPMRDDVASARIVGLRARHLPVAVDGSPEITAAYTLFRRTVSAEGVPPIPLHMEFLVDRQGYIRARWIPGDGPGWTDPARLLRELAQLAAEPPGAPAPEEHVH